MSDFFVLFSFKKMQLPNVETNPFTGIVKKYLWLKAIFVFKQIFG